jgi:glyoxylase-like metal-dependent hydrolase (beta-lactamase superfamily II)
MKLIERWMMLWVLMLAASASFAGVLEQKTWIHGAADCSQNRDPPLEVFKFDDRTYILRQNKCLDFEAPFIYVLFGERMVFVQDTGATAEADKFPIYDTIRKLIEQQQAASGTVLRVLVTHSHSHGDHRAGDAQFRGRPQVTLVEPTAEGVRGYFGFKAWPKGEARVDLGGRELTVLPIPGHQDESIAVYDSRTGWLLTGDTVYPGRLYVMDWNAYRASVHRLVEFARSHPVSAVLGTHIEMSRKPSQDFPMGSTFQPNEAPLPLTVQELQALDAQLQQAGKDPRKLTLPKFIVTPIGWFQRAVSTVLGWFAD